MSALQGRYSRSELFSLAKRAENDGEYDYAHRLYSHLAADDPAAPETQEARRALSRLPVLGPPAAIERPPAGERTGPPPMPPAASGWREPPSLAGPGAAPAHAPAPGTPHMPEPGGPPPHSRQPSQAMGHPAAGRPQSTMPQHRASGGVPPAVAVSEAPGAGRLAPSPDALADMEDAIAAAVPRYRAGRLLAGLLTTFGWLALLLAIALAGLTVAGPVRTLAAPGPVGVPVGLIAAIGLFIAGMVMVLAGQVARAIFDAAAAAREVAEIERMKMGL
ncbi:MAG: hypothetical protein NW205_11505 [Hyphomicrobiaceae bacterium]|nr:hypothetical protein [Hyphomicrobiaceae bacterium]